MAISNVSKCSVTWIKVLSLQSLKFHKTSGNFRRWVEVWIWESLSNLSSELRWTWGLVLLCSYTHLSLKCRTAGRAVHPYHSLEAVHTEPSLKHCSQNDVLRISLGTFSTLHLGLFSILVLAFFICWLRIKTVSQVF